MRGEGMKERRKMINERKGKEKRRQEERERKETLSSTDSFCKYIQQPVLGQVEFRSPEPSIILIPLRVCISRKLDLKPRWDSNPDTLVWDVGILSSNLTTWTNRIQEVFWKKKKRFHRNSIGQKLLRFSVMCFSKEHPFHKIANQHVKFQNLTEYIVGNPKLVKCLVDFE